MSRSFEQWISQSQLQVVVCSVQDQLSSVRLASFNQYDDLLQILSNELPKRSANSIELSTVEQVNRSNQVKAVLNNKLTIQVYGLVHLSDRDRLIDWFMSRYSCCACNS